MNHSISDPVHEDLYAEIKHVDTITTDETNSVIDHLVNIVGGHELRTPLSIIQGFTELLENYDESPEMRKYMFDSIKDSVKRINNLSNRIGIWHRLKSGYRFKAEKVSVNKLYVVELLDELLTNDKNVYVNVFVEEENSEIVGNPQLISTVITELLDNAIKFSEKNSDINIRMYTDANNLFFAITNSSDKISFSEIVDYKAFTQFNRNIYEQQGLGLGIDIAAMALKSMDGHLLVEKRNSLSGMNKDITFFAQFPLVQ